MLGASWKCQGVNIPRGSPQPLINGNQKKISSFLTLSSGRLRPLLQFLKETLLTNASTFTSFPFPNPSPTPRPLLPGITLQVNHSHSSPRLGLWYGGNQPKTDIITNCDGCKEGARRSATSQQSAV